MQMQQNVAQMHRCHENDSQKQQNVAQMHRPHENDIQKFENVLIMEGIMKMTSRTRF